MSRPFGVHGHRQARQSASRCAALCFIVVMAASGCSAPSREETDAIRIPIDLLPRVLVHAAAEELRPPELRCENPVRDEDWIALAEELRAADVALRDSSGGQGGMTSDAEITARLKLELETRGWPSPCALGDRASKQLWFVVQHTPDRALLDDSLGYFEEAASFGFVPYSQVATMRDRILMYAGEPQIYGTQFVCDVESGRWVRWELAEPDHLEDLRRRAGLIPGEWEERVMNHGRPPCGG